MTQNKQPKQPRENEESILLWTIIWIFLLGVLFALSYLWTLAEISSVV